MSDQKRFGVSLPSDLVDLLEKAAERLNMSRSKIIEIALRSFFSYTPLEYALDKSIITVLLVAVTTDKNVNKVVNKMLKYLKSVHVETVSQSGHFAVMGTITDSPKRIIELTKELSSIQGVAVYPLLISFKNEGPQESSRGEG